MLEAGDRALEHTRYCAGVRERADLMRDLGRRRVDLLEVLDRERGRGAAVELCDLVQNVDCLLLAAFGEEELGRLVECEDKVSEEEDGEGHTAEDDDHVPPAHVVADSAACLARLEQGVPAPLELDVAAPFGGSSVGDAAGDGHADGLPQGQEGDEVSAALGQELERYGCVDGDVAAETDRREEVDSADGAVVELGRGLGSARRGLVGPWWHPPRACQRWR